MSEYERNKIIIKVLQYILFFIVITLILLFCILLNLMNLL